MDRETLYRGKRVDNGEWIEGDLIRSYPINGITKYFIGYLDLDDLDADVLDADVVEIIPSTLGQYTGLTDKNGEKIFEGDILISYGTVLTIKYFTQSARFLAVDENDVSYPINLIANKIIGNIHDNPELLEA